MSAERINEIVRGKRGIRPETARLLAQAFGTTPQFWINLQTNRDLAGATSPCRIRRFHSLHLESSWPCEHCWRHRAAADQLPSAFPASPSRRVGHIVMRRSNVPRGSGDAVARLCHARTRERAAPTVQAGRVVAVSSRVKRSSTEPPNRPHSRVRAGAAATCPRTCGGWWDQEVDRTVPRRCQVAG